MRDYNPSNAAGGGRSNDEGLGGDDSVHSGAGGSGGSDAVEADRERERQWEPFAMTTSQRQSVLAQRQRSTSSGHRRRQTAGMRPSIKSSGKGSAVPASMREVTKL